jgi:TIR domain
MQALTPALFPCYAAPDREIAGRIAAFLESGAGVRVLLDEGEMRPGEDLAQKAREARTADTVLMLFSRHSLPSPWPRAKWEDALQKEPAEEKVRIAFVKCGDCSPPRVLAPQFDLTGLPLLMLRRLKRWVRGGDYREPESSNPDLANDVEALGVAIADQPGTATVGPAALALEFARIFREDFDEVVRLQCGGRTMVALAGDLGAQLGVRLEGDLESNLSRLRSFCSYRRFLLWLEGASAEEAGCLAPGAGSSTIVSCEPRAEVPPDDESLRDIQYTFAHPGLVDWAEFCRLARQGFRWSREQGRLAEAFELLERWHALAEARADRPILEESAREMVWILEGWDRIQEARRLEYRRATQYEDQMPLLFGEML